MRSLFALLALLAALPSRAEVDPALLKSLLEADDILLSPGTAGDVLLKIFCDYDKRVGTLEVLEADRPIMVGETTVRTTSPLKDGDTIRIDVGQFLRCNFSERIIEEERNIIRTLEVSEVTHHFSSGDVGLEGISFNVTRGELVCVMGASGSGKSTLLKGPHPDRTIVRYLFGRRLSLRRRHHRHHALSQ